MMSIIGISDVAKNYDFNTADTLNTLLLNCMFASGQLKEGEMDGNNVGNKGKFSIDEL